MAKFSAGLTGKCPHCLQGVRFEGARQFAGGNNWGATEGYILGNHYRVIEELIEVLRLTTATCPECHRLIVTLETTQQAKINGNFEPEQEFLIWPRQSSRPIPPEVQDEHPKIAEDYVEAVAVLNISPKASAALSRRCLQAVLKEKGGANQYRLVDQIKSVKPNIPSYIASYVDAIRQVGNYAAHQEKEKGSGKIVDVEPGEAEWNLDVLDMLFDHYYVTPAQNEQKKDALNKKLKAMGKKPIP